MEIHEFIHSVERLRGDLLRQARRLLDSEDDTEDAVQETLMKLWIMKERILNADKMRNMATAVCPYLCPYQLRPEDRGQDIGYLR